ncbi:FecR family protein [Sphingobacterium thalpophilum]|uniref:Fec operon regulator FecR n=1 Tax=Sphingobacterium thalpophilum TaxID=259 RepID=A0A4U9VKB1_9SPHI|nr:FecR domain-containing protein [Sphingobacterium thalpophilum]VTR43804.1 fec operon regulator FecR [Sphingobacterium thalpophilum]
MSAYQSIQDFILDESFFRYAVKQDASEIRKWENYIKQHPEQAALIARARQELLDMHDALYLIDAEQNYARLAGKLHPPVSTAGGRRRWDLYAAAAVALLCLMASLWLYQYHFYPTRTVAYQTQPAEKKTIHLPDGTLVKLNAASKLEVSEGFGKTDRAVKLVGEAYMEVAKNKALPFTVATQALQVRVLGTTINVRAYANEELTAASLIEGSAEVILRGKAKSPIRLKPKDKVVAAVRDKKLADQGSVPTETQPEDYKMETVTQYDAEQRLAETSWTQQKLVFVNEPLSSIAKTLERWYNIQIEFQDPHISARKYTAAFDDREELQYVLESLRSSIPFSYRKTGPRTIAIYLTDQYN